MVVKLKLYNLKLLVKIINKILREIVTKRYKT